MKPFEFMEAMTDIRSDFLAEALDCRAFPEAADAPKMTEEEPAVTHPMRSRILAVLSAAACIGLIAGGVGLIYRLKNSGPVRNPAETTAESGTETTAPATDDSESRTTQDTQERVSTAPNGGTTAGQQTQDGTADSQQQGSGTAGTQQTPGGTATTLTTAVRGTESSVSSRSGEGTGAESGQVKQELKNGIAAYVEEHFRRSDGAAVHFLDPTGWYSREITKAPDYRKLEGTAYLYTDDFGIKFSAGDWAGSLTYLTAYSLFHFELADLSDEAAAAFDAVLTEFAASRETLVFTHDQRANPQLNDYALHTDTAELLMKALDARPEVKALISQIQYTPVFVDTVSLRTDNGLQFMLTEGVPANALKKLAADLKKNWTVTDDNHIAPDTVTTESLVDVIATVSAAYPVAPMLSPLDSSSKGIALQNDGTRLLYQKDKEKTAKQLCINPQFDEWDIDEEAVKNGKNGDPAGTYTNHLLYGLAFRWNGTGTPEGAEIGGYTLTGTDGWISKDQTQVQDMEAFAAVLPGTEHYDDCTPFVPDDLKQSGLWITGGVRDAKYICALLNDTRVDAQGLLYITEKKTAYVDAEDEDDKQAMILDDLSFDEISACLRPLTFAE
ncbi:MAG: hypothetical protein IK107_05515 [Oscillospiraceae bacterium]|nr:hypothetical protein [Oscillospiraceae bacterium]